MLASRMKTVRGDLPQKAFANRLAVHVNTVQRWEAGTRLPCADDLLRMQQQFDININWLLSGDGPKHLSELEQPRPAEVVPIENGFIESFRTWVAELISEDSAYRGWFKVQLMKCFPEFKEWVEKKQGGRSSENSSPMTHENSA
jgi:transcriptional regulator with XRE-family HTH domain